MWGPVVVMNCIKRTEPEPVSQWGLVMSELTVSPKGFDESLHFLRFSLHTNMSLELSQGFVELHAGKIHLIHDTTVKEETQREKRSRGRLQSDIWISWRLSQRLRRWARQSCMCVGARVYACAWNYEHQSAVGKTSRYSHTSITEALTWKTYTEATCLHIGTRQRLIGWGTTRKENEMEGQSNKLKRKKGTEKVEECLRKHLVKDCA